MSLIGSIKSKVSKIFHMDGHQRAATTNGANAGDRGYAPSSLYTIPRPSPMLDPSTNFNPLSLDQEQPDESHEPQRVNGKKRSADVSKHTFYIVNAQMRLKLCARNEVRQISFRQCSMRIHLSVSAKCCNGSLRLRRPKHHPTMRIRGAIDLIALLRSD